MTANILFIGGFILLMVAVFLKIAVGHYKKHFREVTKMVHWQVICIKCSALFLVLSIAVRFILTLNH